MIAKPAHRARLVHNPGLPGVIKTFDSAHRDCDVTIEPIVMREIDHLAAAFSQKLQHSVALSANHLG